MILRVVCSWNLHQTYILKNILFRDVISFDPCKFQKSGIILLISAKIKNWKSYFFFSKSTYYWKKIFISRYDMIIFIYKSWSGWLICMLKSHVMWFFWFQNVANYILFARTKFLVSTLLIFKENSEIFNSFFCGQKGITVRINLANKN